MAEHRYASWSAAASRARQRACRAGKEAMKGKRAPKPSPAGKAPKKGDGTPGMKVKKVKTAPKPSPAGKTAPKPRPSGKAPKKGGSKAAPKPNPSAGQAAKKETPHRFCCRCCRRLDKCLAAGCKPYTFRLCANNFKAFRKARQRPQFPRYHTDCIDMRCGALWGTKALKEAGAEVALLGLSAYAHFNRLRTGGVLLPPLLEAGGWAARWAGVRRSLKFCKSRWGRGKCGERLGLYSPSCKPGCCFPSAASGDKHDSIMEGLQRLRRSKEFTKAAKLLDDGVGSVGTFDLTRRALQALAKANKGALGPYHLHMVFSVAVAMEWIPSRCVNWWSVAGGAGTTEGLGKVYLVKPAGRLGFPALAELWRRLAELGELRQREHVGSVGAQLCFWTRSLSQAAASTFDSRLGETTEQWDSDLADLREAGVVLGGWHKGA